MKEVSFIYTNLEGLGNLNKKDSDGVIISPPKSRSICNTKYNSFSSSVMHSENAEELLHHLEEWFKQFDCFLVNNALTTEDTEQLEFNVQVDEIKTTYRIIPTFNAINTMQFIQTKVKEPENTDSTMVFITLDEPTIELSRTLTRLNADLISPCDMQTIDYALTSPVKYIATNKRFYNIIAVAINRVAYKDNGAHLVEDAKNQFSSIGTNVLGLFSEGLQQLKDSVITVTDTLKTKSEPKSQKDVVSLKKSSEEDIPKIKVDLNKNKEV